MTKLPPERLARPALAERLGDWIGKLPWPGRPPAEESAGGVAHTLPSAAVLARNGRLPEALRARLGAPPADPSLPERKPTLERLHAALEAGASVALIGPRGSGKTSLLARLVEELEERGTPARAVRFEDRVHDEAGLFAALARDLDAAEASRDAVLEALGAGSGRVLCVDSLHALARRRIGGLTPLVALLDLVAATRGRHVWVASCDDQAWTLLDRRIDLDASFPVRLASALDAPSLRAALEADSAAAGWALHFEASGEERNGSGAADPAERFATALQREVRGNFAAARVQLLAQAIPEPGSPVLRLGPYQSHDLGFVRSLDRPSLITLATLLQHGGLSAAEHADLLLVQPAGSARRLAALAALGLLEAPAQPGGRFEANPAVETRVAALLHDLNLLPADAFAPS